MNCRHFPPENPGDEEVSDQRLLSTRRSSDDTLGENIKTVGKTSIRTAQLLEELNQEPSRWRTK